MVANQAPDDTLFVLLPLILAGLITIAAMVAIGIPFNFANVICLPLLLGIGVDNGVHMVHCARPCRCGGSEYPADQHRARRRVECADDSLRFR